MSEERISLAHGNGGKLTRQLIEKIIAPAFNMSVSLTSQDAALINSKGSLKITTDGYTVDPLFFPGGNIGKLAVCGTVNDLVVSGAKPTYMTVNLFIEEGFSFRELKLILKSIGEEAKVNDVLIVAGDTKVLPKGSIAGIQIATTGVGEIVNPTLAITNIQAGDKVYVSGPVGDHGAAVMLAREAFGLQGEIESDCQSVKSLALALASLPGLKFMRDPTRGGLASVCHEVCDSTKLGIKLMEKQIPIRSQVKAFCELLGFNPLYLACEGRIVFVTSGDMGEKDLKSLSNSISQIGTVSDQFHQLIMETFLGGTNIVPELENESLPRIC